jgi:acyl-coenzyme A thioesterase PaaI-like protein
MASIKTVLKYIRFWPPYLAAGIRVAHYDKTINSITITMPLLRRNTNYVGTHFGGNLYSMCDPWYMFILLHHLGPGYIVWDKAAEIEFIKPGKGLVTARFEISKAEIDALKQKLQDKEKDFPIFKTEIVDTEGQTVARIQKTVYVKEKSTRDNHA